MQKIGEAMQKQGAQAGQPSSGPQETQKPDIGDAEVEILDDEEKK